MVPAVERKEAGTFAALCALVATVAIGQAVQASNGALHPAAIKHLAVALAALVLGLAFPSAGTKRPYGAALLLAAGGLATLWQLRQLGSGSPAIYLRAVSFLDFNAELMVFAVLSASLIAPKRWLGPLHGAAWLLSFFMLGKWLIAASPSPFIDVFAWTNHGLDALKAGNNPYTTFMPNIYGHTKWYAPGMADAQWVKTGYPYPPFSLMLSAAGWLFGDMRWANLALLGVAGGALVWGKGRLGALAAVLLLTTPRILFILEQAWTDAYAIGLMALVVLTAKKWPKATPYLFGLLLGTKQYLVFIAPLGLLLIERPWTRRQVLTWVGQAVLAGTIVTLPWLLWSPKAFIGALTVSGHPFRPDALSFLAATAVDGQPVYPVWIQLVLLVPAYVLIWFRAPKGPAGFALSSALVICVFFAFSKHAFCNHHFMTLGFAAIALGFFQLDETPADG